jgi:hypothetical protein
VCHKLGKCSTRGLKNCGLHMYHWEEKELDTVLMLLTRLCMTLLLDQDLPLYVVRTYYSRQYKIQGLANKFQDWVH